MQELCPEMQEKLDQHLRAAAQILYQHTEPEKLESFESIEWEVRDQMLQQVAPKIGEFFCQKEDKDVPGSTERSRAAWERFV